MPPPISKTPPQWNSRTNQPQQQLNSLGNFTNGVLAGFSKICASQWGYTCVTYLMTEGTLPPARCLYRGFIPNCTSIVPAQGVGFLVDGIARKHLGNGKELTSLQKIAAGAIAGIAVTPIVTLADRIMILHQLHGGSYKNILQVATRLGVVRGLFKGFMPTLIREKIFFVSVFGTSEVVDTKLEPYVWKKNIRELIAGTTTGLIGGAVSTPPALVKTRMQGKWDMFSMRQTIGKIIEQDGYRGLMYGWKGRAALITFSVVYIRGAKQFTPPYLPSFMHQKES